MRRTLLVVVFLCGLAGLALFWALSRGEQSPTEAASAPAVQLKAAVASEAGISASTSEAEEAETRAELEATMPEEVDPETVAEQPQLAELRGRFLLPDGVPASDVKLKLGGWVANNEREMRYGVPADWNNLEGTTDAEGRFSFRFDPPLAFQFVLQGSLAGYGGVSWRWSSLPPREVTDVGDTTFVPAGTVRGRVVDGQGLPAGGSWVVYGETVVTTFMEGRDATRSSALADDTTGEFVLEGLPIGPVHLKAQSPIANWVDGPTITLKAGETVNADIVYSGPSIRDRITVVTSHRPIYVFSEPLPGSIKLLGNGVERVATKIAGSSQSWSFNDLPPGSYTIQIDDPLFEPWSEAGVKPGTSVKARLRASGAVALEVVDAKGRRVEDYRLAIDFPSASFGPSSFELRKRGEPAPEGEIYRGLIPTGLDRSWVEPASNGEPEHAWNSSTPASFDLLVDSGGFSTGLARVESLRVGETRAVRIELQPETTLSGRIVGASVEKVSGVGVVLAEQAIGLDGALQFSAGWSNSPGFALESRTDEKGRFRFESLRPGSYLVVARFHGDLHAAVEPFELAAGEHREIEIAAPRHGGIEGKIRASAASLTHSWVEASSNIKPGAAHEFWMFEGEPPPRAAVQLDGSFVLPMLPAGSWLLTLSMNPGPLQNEKFLWSANAGTRIVLGSVLVSPPEVARAEFELAEKEPGTLRALVTIDGQPAIGREITAERVAADGSGYRLTVPATTDGEGVAVFERLEPGEWSVAMYWPKAPEWRATSVLPSRLAPRQQAEIRLDVVLHSGRLRVLDATGTVPRAHTVFRLQPADLPYTASHVTTDADGYVDCKLPGGRYVVNLGATRHTIEWTASGPVPSEVKL